MTAALFARPRDGRVWLEDDPDTPVRVNVVGLDTDTGVAVVVDEDAQMHFVPFKQVDFLDMAPGYEA